jgi:hypothetical protein
VQRDTGADQRDAEIGGEEAQGVEQNSLLPVQAGEQRMYLIDDEYPGRPQSASSRARCGVDEGCLQCIGMAPGAYSAALRLHRDRASGRDAETVVESCGMIAQEFA